MRIFAIETSCDETAASVVSVDDSGLSPLSSVVSSQVEIHASWGGVVPNLAAREHTKNILPVCQQALFDAGVSWHEIDAIAVTHAPGLIPALLVGVSAAKTLSFVHNKPLIPVHHIAGHIYANFFDHDLFTISQENVFPLLALVVSGGHTQLVLMRSHCTYEIIGQTQDDAVGEAFDKTSRVLGLGYPGGPVVSQRADAFSGSYDFCLPRPMIDSKDLDFSFSGLKTAALYLVQKKCEENPDILSDDSFVGAVCHEFQNACVDLLVSKTCAAALAHNPKTVVLAGGVSANRSLRERLGENISQKFPIAHYVVPQMAHSIDNAAMIGAVAAYQWQEMNSEQKKFAKDKAWQHVNAHANMSLDVI
ncbi:MAG: tRNA (adenosine(37)-N6)-threonylcarbamoyltransferase complex transferase subunit TsaD [Candidatus Moranbacteria bacterium]|nr:tRNA (adenosine(37)-N6)-threonylcarbamoyltransferase complex transferase subunit TsaD [Candidatus Moranbacteria bacterium]